MIEDFGELPDGLEIDCDICIVGGGPVGISIALALADSGLEVVLLEGGGRDYDADSQAIYEGELAGIDYTPLDVVRLRYLGGTSNHWGGNCPELDPIDFVERPWIPHSGMPLDYADFAKWLPAAYEVLELARPFDNRAYWDEFGVPLPSFDAEKLDFKTSQRTLPVRFGDRYGATLEAAGKARVLLNANVVEIVTNADASHVQSVRIQSFGGSGGGVRARRFVLACGGIENARLLLANRAVEPHGLGNRYDLVGRFFADHPHMPIGEVITNAPATLLEPLGEQYRGHEADRQTRYRPFWLLTPALQERYGLPNSAATLFTESAKPAGIVAAGRFVDALRAGRWPNDAGAMLLSMGRDADEIAGAAWRRFFPGERTYSDINYIGLRIILDSVPNPASRITLSHEVDAFGMRRVELDYRASKIESRGIPILGEIIGAELARLGLGRLKLHDWVADIGNGTWDAAYYGSAAEERFGHPIWAHHYGTTRMASDPRKGVVDADCKVHGIDNLYIAGSSIFATPGNANPTLNIVAFGLRLADHLATELV